LPFSKGDNSKRIKIHKIFSKTSPLQIRKLHSIKLDTNYPWVKGIQVRLNKGSGPLQSGENYKNVKMGWGHLNIFFSRITCPEKLKLS
jgi:hypothetical protein